MSFRLAFSLFFVMLALAGCRPAYFGALNLAADGNGPAPSSAVFDDAQGLALDWYRPEDCQNAPVLVFFYGGTWQHGERRWYRFVGEQFAARGVLTVIPDYRKAPAAPFPAFVEDAASAVAFVHAHAAEWCGDRKRITVAGHSAGAHLAALLATDARYLATHNLVPQQALAGLIGLAGPYDFLPITADGLRIPFPDPKRDSDTQPVRFVDGNEPPALLIHGTDDRLVWTRNSIRLDAALSKAGVTSELMQIEGLGHTRLLNQLGDDDDPHQVIAAMMRFLQSARATP